MSWGTRGQSFDGVIVDHWSDADNISGKARGAEDWRRVAISRIEDLSDAVYGAGLKAMQMSMGPVTGSLAFAERDGVVYSSGRIEGKVALAGPLSEDKVTLGVGLRIAPGSWHWFKEVATGDVGVFLPGDEHDSLYMPGSLYATATLSAERLEEEAARTDLVLDRKTLGGTGIHQRKVALDAVAPLARQMEQVHLGEAALGSLDAGIGEQVLRLAIAHYAREPRAVVGHANPIRHARIVSRARAYIADNLHEPLSVDVLAAAAHTSRRTLHRAFLSVLDETPQSYVRRLRLHRIRYDLASEAEAACTVALVANSWGIGELGRLSGLYRELFGELPSETLKRSRRPFEAAA